MKRRQLSWLRSGLLASLIGFAVSAPAATFTVDSTADASDPVPADGVCGTVAIDKTHSGGPCTLRAAIESANVNANTDAIQFNLPAGSVINLTQVLPDLSTNMSITGPGPDKLTVSRDAGGSYRVFHVVTTGSVTFSGLTISNGTGGIISDNAAALNVTDCILSGNSTVAGLGGAIYNNSTGPVTVSNTTMSGNSAGRGGAIFNNSTAPVTITNSTLSNNLSNGSSTVGGGGIYNNSTGTVNITNCRFSQNRAIASGTNNGNGGGIYNQGGTVNVLNSTIEQNGIEVPNGDASGGGVFNASGIVNVANSTIRVNSVGGVSGQNFGVNGSGGGIYNETGTANITNSTLSSNIAAALGARIARGGGIFSNTGTMNVSNSTLSSNACTGFPSPMMVGGGVFNAAGTFAVKSTIIALSRVVDQNSNQGSNPDASGAFTSQGFNLIGKRDGSIGFTQPTDQTGTLAAPLDPRLAASEAFNGGSTATVALLPGSPAIDKGTSQCLTCGPGVLATDQRDTGFPRTFNDPATPNANGGDGTDIGAFEAQTSLVTRLANISTRLPVQTGDNALIGGFIISGTQAKKVILRAIGPSLPFSNKLANPTLELFGPSGLIASNDDWINSTPADKQAIIDSTIPPSNDLESAIVATLPANNAGYTAIVRGANNGTGIGVVEAYDLDQAESKLANISTRGFVQTGDNVLIAGTIMLGPSPQKVIVRALGPSLPIAGKMANPKLELREQNGFLVDENDNWVDSLNKQAIIDSTIPPTHDFESAIVATLPASGASYTAILRGVNNTIGIAVVEVYALNN
jgi:CSLREA domain-containing protein